MEGGEDRKINGKISRSIREKLGKEERVEKYKKYKKKNISLKIKEEKIGETARSGGKRKIRRGARTASVRCNSRACR